MHFKYMQVRISNSETSQSNIMHFAEGQYLNTYIN